MEAKAYKYLKFARFKELMNWSAAFALSADIEYNPDFRLEKIGRLLKRNRLRIHVQPNEQYQRVTIRLYGKGLQQRDVVQGENIGTKTQFVISEGQFLMSKIDARNGAFGIVPAELEGAIVTQDFLSYDINTEIISPAFFLFLTTTKHFQSICERASAGTTGRRRVDENIFLNFQIPLPSLAEQDALVAAYQANLAAAGAKEAAAAGIKQRLETLLCTALGITTRVQENAAGTGSRIKTIRYKDLARWSLDYLLRGDSFSFAQAHYPVKKLGVIMRSISGGKTPNTGRDDYWNGNIHWTSPKDFDGIVISTSEDLITDKAVSEAGLNVYPAGTLLSVFRSGILRHSFPIAITTMPTAINQDLKAIVVDETQVLPMYFLYYVHALQRMVIEQASKKSVTVESINVHEFLELPFVLPPLEAQGQIVGEIAACLKINNQLLSHAAQERAVAVEMFERAIFSREN